MGRCRTGGIPRMPIRAAHRFTDKPHYVNSTTVLSGCPASRASDRRLCSHTAPPETRPLKDRVIPVHRAFWKLLISCGYPHGAPPPLQGTGTWGPQYPASLQAIRGPSPCQTLDFGPAPSGTTQSDKGFAGSTGYEPAKLSSMNPRIWGTDTNNPGTGPRPHPPQLYPTGITGTVPGLKRLQISAAVIVVSAVAGGASARAVAAVATPTKSLICIVRSMPH